MTLSMTGYTRTSLASTGHSSRLSDFHSRGLPQHPPLARQLLRLFSSSALPPTVPNELHTQLHYTKSSLATHVDKVLEKAY